ncbi:unnamed protein product [Rhizophagus irregularis]|nr:unnamed protein product [Rhizophagus irregularis]
MPFLCSCRICKINSKDGNGKWLSIRKTFKKHQKREKANIEKINESEAESGSETKSDSESISSCNAAEKRKFEDDESDKSDTSSESNISNNDHVPVILKDIPKRSEDYDDDDSDEPFLDNEDYNNGNPIPNNEDYDKNSDRQSLDNKDCDEEDDKGDIETESDCSQTSAYISEENDELTDDDKEFEESEMTNINDDELIQGLRLLHTKVLHSISDIAFNKILDNVNSNLTIYKLKKKINSIVPFEPHRYDTCKNSCIAFTSSYENLASCPICGENRFDDNGKPVNTTFFFSVKERLIIQYKNKERAEELQYRSNYSQNKGEEEIYADIFDGLLYKDLLQRELQELEGVQCIDGRTNEPFILRAHLLTWTGDVPALSKSLNLSGHNSYKGCRFCMIKGTCHPSNKHIYYPSSAFCNIRNHDDTINMGKLIEEETNKDRKDEMIRETGIKGYNAFILRECGTVNVYLDKRHLQGWANFVKSVKLCLEPEISEEQIDDVQILLKKFSDYYEREYYQNNGQRLAACKISFHYLLHVANSIKYCGPSWTHWQFPIERVCGILQPLIKSKIKPYSNLANMLTLLQQFYMLPFFSISKAIFKENPLKQWSKERVFSTEGYEEKFYSPSTQYSLLSQEHKHLIKFYEGSSNINRNDLEMEVNNYGVRYGRLRTSDGQYISSCCIKRNNKIARNNYCAQIRRTIDKLAHRPNAPPQLVIVDIYGIVNYYLVHEFNHQVYMLAYVQLTSKIVEDEYGCKHFTQFRSKEFIDVSDDEIDEIPIISKTFHCFFILLFSFLIKYWNKGYKIQNLEFLELESFN